MSGGAGCRHRDIPGRAGSLCREYIDIEGRVNDQTPTELAQDGIEQGKRLIRLSGDKGLSLSERVANHFYRLTWRTPLHAMRLKGKYPLKLLAVPDDPIPGDERAGKALRAGYFLFRRKRVGSGKGGSVRVD